MFNDPKGDKFARGNQLEEHPIDANWSYASLSVAENSIGDTDDGGGGGGYSAFWDGLVDAFSVYLEDVNQQGFKNKYFLTKDDAAYFWAGQYIGPTIGKDGVEFGSSIFSVTVGEVKYYSYNEPEQGTKSEVEWNQVLQDGQNLEGVIHSHTPGKNEIGGSPNEFSSKPGIYGRSMDIELMNDKSKNYGKVDWYLAAPDLTLRVSRADNRTRGIIVLEGVGTANPINRTGIFSNGQPVYVPVGKPLVSYPVLPKPKFGVFKPYNF